MVVTVVKQVRFSSDISSTIVDINGIDVVLEEAVNKVGALLGAPRETSCRGWLGLLCRILSLS